MKKISLGIPLYWEEDPRVAFREPAWLKVESNYTVPYQDRTMRKEIRTHKQIIQLNMKVPEELSIVEVAPPGMATPADMVGIFWNIAMADQNWRITGLKDVNIIFNDGAKRIAVENERPSLSEWKMYTTQDEQGQYLWARPWVLATYATKFQTYGVLFWKEILRIRGMIVK